MISGSFANIGRLVLTVAGSRPVKLASSAIWASWLPVVSDITSRYGVDVVVEDVVVVLWDLMRKCLELLCGGGP